MNKTTQTTDRSKLTFSQAEGIEPLPGPLKLGELSKQARALLWREFHQKFRQATRHGDGYSGPSTLGTPWVDIMYRWWVEELNQPSDEFSNYVSDITGLTKDLILSGSWNKVFDFVQFVMRSQNCPYGYPDRISWVLRKSRTAYTVVPKPFTIVPSATDDEGDAIKKAFTDLDEAGFGGARTHLRQAAEELNSGNYGDAVRESVHAVEATARKLDPKASKTLSPALKALEDRVGIHPALKAGFQKIYGYTSDEGGIRHALLEDDRKVDIEDAVFMIGACASFVSYLVGKARKAGLIQD